MHCLPVYANVWLSCENVLPLTETAELYDLKELLTMCIKLIVQEFGRMKDTFLSLSCNMAYKVLSSQELLVSNEIEVAEAVVEWLKNNPDHTNSDVHTMISAVRITECDPLFVKTALMESDDIKMCTNVLSMLSLYCDQKCYGLFMPKDIPLHFPRRSTGLRFQVS